MQTRFILIETSHAGNVGSTARAMRVMGFDDLVLVKPRWSNVLRREETVQRASGALDVLEKCRIVDTLDEALEADLLLHVVDVGAWSGHSDVAEPSALRWFHPRRGNILQYLST